MNRALTIVLVIAAVGAIAFSALAQEAPAEKPCDGPGVEGPRGEKGPRGPRGPDRFFKRHDANQDGKVSLEELLAPAKKMMEDVDANDDGFITREELAAAKKERKGPKGEGEGEGMRRRGHRGPRGGEGGERPERPERRERPSPEDIFKKLDTDGDGNVSLEEFKAGRPQRGPRGGGRR